MKKIFIITLLLLFIAGIVAGFIHLNKVVENAQQQPQLKEMSQHLEEKQAAPTQTSIDVTSQCNVYYGGCGAALRGWHISFPCEGKRFTHKISGKVTIQKVTITQCKKPQGDWLNSLLMGDLVRQIDVYLTRDNGEKDHLTWYLSEVEI